MRKSKHNSNRKGMENENPSSRQTGAPGFRKYTSNPRNLPTENASTSTGNSSRERGNGPDKRNTADKRNNEMPWDGAD